MNAPNILCYVNLGYEMSNEPILVDFQLKRAGDIPYGDCTNSPKLSFPGFAPYTVEALILPTSLEGVSTILSRFDGGKEAEYGLWLSGGKLASYRNVSPWTLGSTTRLVKDSVYHVAATYDEHGVLRLYINGNLDCQGTFTSQPSAENTSLTIGCRFDHGVPKDFFQGAIYKVRVWNRCLSGEEMNCYLRPFEPGSAPPGLVGDFSVLPLPDEFRNGELAFANTPSSKI